MYRYFFKLSVIVFLLLFIGTKSIAQKNNAITIKAIPKPLFWENEPKKCSFDGKVLNIIAGEKTDMFRDPNVTYNTDNAPKLMFNPDENFVLSAKIEHNFVNKWDGGAIVLKSDSLNWVKFCFEKDYTGAKRVVSVVTKDISDDCNSIALTSNSVYYKIAKADNVITLYYSPDNKKWFLVRHFQFDAKANFTVGFLAQSPLGKKCDVKFSNIQYKAVKIKDPYLGE